MPPKVANLLVTWDGVPEATGYEIKVNGVKVATTGSKARNSRVNVQASSVIEVTDLPSRSLVQVVDFQQVAQ